MTQLSSPNARQHGASLIEILVAMLVMTLGLLAMISLHTAAVRYQKMAEFRGIATQLAEDYGDRMRANLTGARNGNYLRAAQWSATPAKVTDPGICADCEGSDLAKAVADSDVAQWLNNAAGMLPGVGLHVQRPVGALGTSMVMDVWITWLDPATDAADATTNALLTAAYSCPATLGAVPSELRCLRYRFTL